MTNKQTFKTRFKELFPELRLLAIQLNGFTHSAIVDSGNADSVIKRLSYSNYLGNMEKQAMGIPFDIDGKLKSLFSGYANYSYQNNAVEIVYITPDKR
jgi:hypothetical protein